MIHWLLIKTGALYEVIDDDLQLTRWTLRRWHPSIALALIAAVPLGALQGIEDAVGQMRDQGFGIPVGYREMKKEDRV